MTAERLVYRAADMRRLVDPKVIAVVGASETTGSPGNTTMANLAGFSGKVYAVNPKYTTVQGRACVPTLLDLPETPDCVAMCVARPLVDENLRQAVTIGAGGAIVYASGYAETSLADRIAAQHSLVQLAQNGAVRMAGPNTVGLANVASGAVINFMIGCAEMLQGNAGRVGIVTQSGALGYSLLQSVKRGVRISHYLAAGNSADVDVCDYLAYLAEHSDVRAIICLFEGVKSGQRFLEAARLAARNGKALIVNKAGNGQVSGKAAMSHTGTLVGSSAGYRAAFEEANAIRCDDFESVLETASLFAKAPRPKHGRNVGIMATSGGAGVINADQAEEHGLALPAIAPATRAALQKVVPEFGSVANPADITSEALRSIASFTQCLQAFADDPGFSAVIVPFVYAHPIASGARAPVLSDVASKSDCLIVAVWMPEWLEGPGAAELEADERVALFRSPRRAFEATRAWLDWHERRDHIDLPAHRRAPTEAAARARTILQRVRGRGAALTERESKALLGAYGIPVPRENLAETPSAAAACAADLGFPIVVKIVSPDIPHKTEVGGIRLGLNTADEVAAAATDILSSVREKQPQARIDGLSVQRMVSSGHELVMGVRVDAQFGPVVVVGSGGILVELMKDATSSLAPISHSRACSMLEKLRSYPLLTGYRNSAALDVDAAADVLCRLSELAADLADVIVEADLNPVIVSIDGAVAADALIVINET